MKIRKKTKIKIYSYRIDFKYSFYQQNNGSESRKELFSKMRASPKPRANYTSDDLDETVDIYESIHVKNAQKNRNFPHIAIQQSIQSALYRILKCTVYAIVCEMELGLSGYWNEQTFTALQSTQRDKSVVVENRPNLHTWFALK